MGESTLPSGNSAATPHVIRCAECHELVPADRVRHREERVKAAARPAPGQWRAGGPPIFRPTSRGPRLATGVRTAAPVAHSAFAIDRVPVCLDCLRRQRLGLYGVCGIAAACLLAGVFLYSQQIDTPSSQEVALQAPQPRTPVTAKPETPAATEAPAGPAPIWAKVISAALPSVTTATAPPVSPPVSSVAAASPSTGSADAATGPGPDTPAEQPASPEVAPDTSSITTATTAPPPAASTADATASADPPIWKADRKASSRKVAKATLPARRGAPSANAVALRNSGYAALEQRRYRDALTLLQQSTLMGDPYAPMYIGQLFEGGIGVPRDVGQASYWYGIAIDRGNSVALTAFNRMRASPY